jgi:hypothetical protein
VDCRDGLSIRDFLLIRLDQHDVRYGAIALVMLLIVAAGAPFACGAAGTCIFCPPNNACR